MSDWQPIETAPSGVFVLCAHAGKKWLRFGNYYDDVGRWYYSGTNERSQWSQVEGDVPTHWMHLPEPPKDKNDE